MSVDDPVAFGLVQSYARPGGNLTGVTDLSLQLGPKRLELFREMIPGLQRVLFPHDATDTVSAKQLQIYREAAHRLGIELVELALRTQVEAQEALMQSQDPTVQAILSPRQLSLNIPGFVLQAASEQAMATMFNDAFYVERGGLASYGPNIYESGQLAARLVDKIGMRHATRQPTSLDHLMVARGENERHIAAAGVSQGSFCGLRSGGAGAKMPFEIPILPHERGAALVLPAPGMGTSSVSRAGAGGRPVTSRISCSLRVSRASKASTSASSSCRCAFKRRLASSWLSPMILSTSASMAAAVSSLNGLAPP